MNASLLAVGVALDADGDITEDACLLRPVKNTQHINVSKLDALINLALKWCTKVIHGVTNALTSKFRLNTKDASNMLI